MAESWASSPASRAVMRANRGRDTRPERALRSAAHARGLRYRVNVRPVEEVRRTADLVFPVVKVAAFLDGCFWHGCSEHYRPAKGARPNSGTTRSHTTDSATPTQTIDSDEPGGKSCACGTRRPHRSGGTYRTRRRSQEIASPRASGLIELFFGHLRQRRPLKR